MSTIDVLPTLLKIAGAPRPGLPGQSLVSIARGNPVPDAGAASRSRGFLLQVSPPGQEPLRGLRRGDWKYVEARPPALFDLGADPAESRNIAASRPRDLGALERAYRKMSSGTASGRSFAACPVEPSSDLLDRLRALGYAGP